MYRQRGYLSVLLLPLLTALLLLALGMISQSSDNRERWLRQTVADNMAGSAAVLLARELNLLAILNRALLGNQLVLAQLVGIASWYAMMQDTAARAAKITAWIPYLNAVTRQIQVMTDTVGQPLNYILRLGIAVQQGLTTAIQLAQGLIRLSFATLIPATLTTIAARHGFEEESFDLFHAPGLLPLQWRWWAYLPLQTTATDDDVLKELMSHSLDPFSQERSYSWFNLSFFKIRKAGGARLQIDNAGNWSWQAMDTVSVHTRILFSRVEVPWGDGAGYLGQPVSAAAADDFGGSPRINSRASRWALAAQGSMGRQATPLKYFNRRRFDVTNLPAAIIRFGDVLARAGVRFSRPRSLFPRADDRTEQPNLFNALWEGELQSLTMQDKLVLAATGEPS
ncbi:hypothetical protein IDSA_11765 [Pseudidiomarina salinarum]|uniref:Uncharacterized protein n=1 Tax=Pseudidiomarina salinarum TaxID=435908 RepID=A0A094JC11_9GAMM|nr:hypothetical protein [Pseudidiomarina salinarum]KFZ30121.1 hypothetical protein IDSA_11765 [Pseudidiomarina salinarum]RUO68244.1 hypothetical protein CWI79_11750 [Pseudidiomarina salinarum]